MKPYKTIHLIVGILAMSTLITACKKDSGPKDLNIRSITAGAIDLNGAVSPTNVPTDASITIEFNVGINPTTANSNTVRLTQDYDDANVPLTITVDGNSLTIAPTNPMGSGILHTLELTSGLMSNDNQPLATVSRTFTTAGTFLPSGLVAYWTFENSANDVVGSFDPAGTGVVDITYTPSRNTAAGNAATFNGTTSIIEIPNGSGLINTNDFTISFWMKTNSTGHTDANGNPKGHFVMGLGAFYGLQFEVFGGYDGAKFAIQYAMSENRTGAEDMWFPALATDNTNGGWQGWSYARSLTVEQMQAKLKDNWVQVTYTFNATTKVGTLYYDGERMKSFDFNLWPDGDAKRTVSGLKYAGTAPDVLDELAFGFVHSRGGTMWDNEPWGGYGFTTANHFRGQLDDIKIYHKVLTATEIQLMYDSEN